MDVILNQISDVCLDTLLIFHLLNSKMSSVNA